MPVAPNRGPDLSRQAADTTASPPAAASRGDNSASTVVESPQGRVRNPLDAHDFPSGGGSGGAQSFSRKTLSLKKKKPKED
jgi:hypothetical protein